MTGAMKNLMNDLCESQDINLSGLAAFDVLTEPGEADLVVELIDLYLTDGADRVEQIRHAELLRKAVDFYRLHQHKDLGANGLHLIRRYEGAQSDNRYDCGRPLPTSGLSCADTGTDGLTLKANASRSARAPEPVVCHRDQRSARRI